jgi:isoleucyl-tRNA synthetase
LETVVAGQGEDAATAATAMLPGGGFIVLDTEVTPVLATEGVARDLVRAVQQARRDAGLHVSDRISLTIQGAPEVFEATVTHRDLLVAETLATQFSSAGPDHPLTDGAGTTVSVGDGYGATIVVAKA